ncbi:MAG: FAD-dependent oxidoreductase [Bacteroidota bacterium]|nr:FAD-dependent oxidoreductase [Bacteroidota bacterium]
MKSTDVLVIGGSAAGLTAALASKSHYPGKSVSLVRKEKNAAIPCGIPYIFGTLEETNQDILPDGGLIKSGVEILVDEVTSLNGKAKTATLKGEGELSYDKLIIATGSRPVVPGWLTGAQLENVYTVPKNLVYLDHMKRKLQDKENIVVIGAGFIGIEMSDELKKTGKNVTLVELQPNVLPLAFDPDVAVEAETILKDRGINVLTGHGVKEIIGKDQVEAVKIVRGDKVEIIKADAVILSMGYEPNVDLARDLEEVCYNRDGFIKVDEYMRTDQADVFAVGDCAEKRDFFTRKRSKAMLASIACAEARVAGMNLYKLYTLKTISGTIAIFSTALNGTGFGAAGLTETIARAEGFDIIVGKFEGVDRHPGVLNNPHKQIVKLIAGRENGIILGGEVMGGSSAGELINIIGLIIQNKMNVNMLMTAQIGTHPMLTASPAAYPLIKAAEVIAKEFWNN